MERRVTSTNGDLLTCETRASCGLTPFYEFLRTGFPPADQVRGSLSPKSAIAQYYSEAPTSARGARLPGLLDSRSREPHSNLGVHVFHVFGQHQSGGGTAAPPRLGALLVGHHRKRNEGDVGEL